MALANIFISSAILFAAVAPSTVTAASTQIFPSLRKKRAAAVTVKTEEKEQANLPEKDEAPLAVPAPVDVGSDGFPQLPAVSSMLSEASGTLKSVSSQASTLQAKVVQAQMQSESKMAKQKAAFEEKLRQQEQGNRMVIAVNANITSEIEMLRKGNAALRKHARDVEEANRVMRTELHTLQTRLGVAKDFTSQSLTKTDDSKNALLQVLQVSGNRHRHHELIETSSTSGGEDDDDDEKSDDTSDGDSSDDEDSDDGASFLSVSMKVHRASTDSSASFMAAMSEMEAAVPAVVGPLPMDAAAASASDPNNLLEVLAKDVAHLAQQEKESEKSLKSMFIRDFRAGAKRHQALMVQQKGLTATRGSLLALQSKLKDAESHLEGTRQQLETRLHGIGQFLQKLAHFAMAPQREVPHMLEVLPKTVSIPVKTAK